MKPDYKKHFHRIFLKLFLHQDIVEFDRFHTSFSAAQPDLGYVGGAKVPDIHDFGLKNLESGGKLWVRKRVVSISGG